MGRCGILKSETRKTIQKDVRSDEKASETVLARKIRKGGRFHWICSKGLWQSSISSTKLNPVKLTLWKAADKQPRSIDDKHSEQMRRSCEKQQILKILTENPKNHRCPWKGFLKSLDERTPEQINSSEFLKRENFRRTETIGLYGNIQMGNQQRVEESF